MASPLVSVVLPVRNGAADLPKAIDTILEQTFTDFELIVVNDGSTDGTAAVICACGWCIRKITRGLPRLSIAASRLHAAVT
jgi:cellulose synthase/poly-beta-1,6-N-acetylglucosamine synthase-like glycosyltransferase